MQETRDKKAKRMIAFKEEGYEKNPWVIDFLKRNPEPKEEVKKTSKRA